MMVERIEINLLPAEYRIRKRGVNIPRSVIYPALLFVALAVGAGLYTMHMNDTEARLNEEIESLTKEIKANEHIQAEMNKIREEKKITDEKIRALERISVDREKWVRLLEILSGNLPSFSWLMSVREEAGPPERLAIEARTYSFPEVAHYMSKLEASSYISGVELAGIEQIAGAQERTVYRFSIVCTLNRDVGLSRSGGEADGGGM